MVFYSIVGLGLLGAAIHLFFDKEARERARILEILLLYLLPTSIGLMGLWAFVGHMFFSAKVASLIGWPSGNPFQKEIAFANLAFGTLGILCIWIRGNFWLATIVGQAILMWGAAGVHLHGIVVEKNYAPDNAGAILYLDILIPLILFILYVDLRLSRRRDRIAGGLDTRGPELNGNSLP